MEKVQSPCCGSKIKPRKHVARTSNTVSFLSALLIILLPKCPLCVTAYMSAILLFFDIDNSELAPFLLHAKPVLGLLIAFMIVFNYKGKRTLIALGIAFTALLLVLLSSYWFIGVLPDWVIYAAFFFAIWYNGNFKHVVNFLRSRMATT